MPLSARCAGDRVLAGVAAGERQRSDAARCGGSDAAAESERGGHRRGVAAESVIPFQHQRGVDRLRIDDAGGGLDRAAGGEQQRIAVGRAEGEREQAALLSNVMFWRLRPMSIVSGEKVAVWLNRAVSVLVVPLVEPGAAPALQLVASVQLVVLLPPVQKFVITVSPVSNDAGVGPMV